MRKRRKRKPWGGRGSREGSRGGINNNKNKEEKKKR